MNDAWLVRPFPHNIKRLDLFRQNGFVAIGWPGIGDLTGKSREDIRSILSGEPYNLNGLELGNAYATIDIFVNRMQLGNLILVPDGDDIYFCEVISDYYLDHSVDNDTDGYSHQRKVQWLSDTSRKDLSTSLRSSLKVHRTTADLSKHYKEIKSLSQGHRHVTAADECNMISVTYPLRQNFSVNFEIPSNITKSEARRLSLYVESLYFSE